jgi:hypothetical protein
MTRPQCDTPLVWPWLPKSICHIFLLLLESAMFIYPLYSHVSFISPSPYNVLHKQVSYDGDNLKTHHLFVFLCIFRLLPSLNLTHLTFSSLTSNLPHFYWASRISEVLVFWFCQFFTRPIMGLGDLKSQRPSPIL